MFCPRCKAEYRDGFYRCEECGVDLVDELPEEEETGWTEPLSGNLMTVATFHHSIEAHLAVSKLESEGIECVLVDEDTASAYPAYSHVVGGIKLQVAAEDALRAKDILGGQE